MSARKETADGVSQCPQNGVEKPTITSGRLLLVVSVLNEFEPLGEK
ncbi:MAG: hypothetical protein II778_03165 [Anaerovibrio sp.]|nr:hypothetical protein [Anaerovibrio sp.]